MGQGPSRALHLPHTGIGDTMRRLSGSHYPARLGSGPDTGTASVNDGVAAGKPQKGPLHPPSASLRDGLPSPISPDSRVGSDFANAIAQAGSGSEHPIPRTATQSSRQDTMVATEPGTLDRSISDSYGALSRQATTLVSSRLTEEPESMGFSELQQKDSRTRPTRFSESLRHLIHKASASLQRTQTMSSGTGPDSPRSPSLGPTELSLSTAPAFATLEAPDMDARGEAYSYYHPPDISSNPNLRQAPPITIPASAAAPIAPGISRTFSSPLSHVSTVTPISPVSPVMRAEGDFPAGYGLYQRPTFGLDGGDQPELPDMKASDAKSATLRRRRELGEPPHRMDSLPPQDIVSDMPSPRLNSKNEPSGNPMDIMKPTTNEEVGWMVKQELVKMSKSPSPAAESQWAVKPEPAQSSSPPPTANGTWTIKQEPIASPPNVLTAPVVPAEISSQPTPEATPEPDSTALPEIEINGEDVDVGHHTWSTPPPSSRNSMNSMNSLNSFQSNPDNTPDTRPTPYTNTPSPKSTAENGDRSDVSPQVFSCEDCNRVFDQYHKLNHHKRYHDRPHECPHANCDMRFGTKTHLDRHINDKHNRARKFYCVQQNCPYSRSGGKSFPRKDNWRRHMQNKHNIHDVTDPGTEYVDEVMGGT